MDNLNNINKKKRFCTDLYGKHAEETISSEMHIPKAG